MLRFAGARPYCATVTTLVDAVVETLKAEGTDTVFGICGGYFFWLLQAFERAGIRNLPSRHEGAAAFSAAAYAQASGRIGVVLGQGPGATNTLTGVASAYCDSTPLLVFASQAPQESYAADAHQEATGSNHGVDQLPLFKAVTRATLRPPTPTSALRSLRRALAVANAERGPVMLEIAANLFKQEIVWESLEPAQYRADPRRVDVAGIEEAARLIARAENPVLVIGNRATHRGLSADIQELCELGRLPLVTTDFAKGIIAEDHPLSVGIVGLSGHPGTLAYLESADLVISIGARLDSKTTLNYRSSLFKNLIQIDEIASDIGRNFPLELGILGDIPASIRALRDALRTAQIRRPASERVEKIRRQHRTYNEPIATEDHGDGLRAPRALHVLRQHLPREALICGDSGLNLQYLKRFFPVLSPDSFFCFYGFAAMGSGLPIAIGVQAARPKDVVVLVIGDGGFLVHAGELQVMAEYGLPIVCVVLNNAGYGQVAKYMDRYIGSTYGCPIKEIDAAKIAEAFGCDGYRARSSSELAAAVEAAVSKRRPAVIDVKIVGENLDDLQLPGVAEFMAARL
ncbi:MAG: acetolactate synthase [Myxococcales bacterium]|nr:acetolactate synthase [Myxococcales bacterium]